MNEKKQEKLLGRQEKEVSKKLTEKKELKETGGVREAASSVVEVIEKKEGKEAGVEFAEGKISEKAGEDKKKAPLAGAAKALTTDEIEAIRAKLLANLPPQTVMMKQIKTKLASRQKSLNKDYRKLKRIGHKAAYQLARVVAQLRKIHEYFALLANATFEVVKQLWLKIVHGV